jgi:hypothetical protein
MEQLWGNIETFNPKVNLIKAWSLYLCRLWHITFVHRLDIAVWHIIFVHRLDIAVWDSNTDVAVFNDGGLKV